MKKLWAGDLHGELDKTADDFNSSISFDSKMYAEDIAGSIAHAKMLSVCGIITEKEFNEIEKGLNSIKADIESGQLAFDYTCEDVHTFVESVLTERIGETGKKLHTARSRNDQVAVDLRLYMKKRSEEIKAGLKNLIAALTEKAESNQDVIMCGYTHLQRAQPITMAHHLLAYAQMFMRDYGRIEDAVSRMNISPLGSLALAGTTYNTDREFEAELLGFDGACENSMDGVSDRDYCVELLAAFSLIMTHLSRLSEEIILWASWEFKYIGLSDAFSTGSSIMPQKKNPDMAELIRGKAGRVYGDLMGTLTMLKGLPLAYNKDMQEDKESIFDGAETVIKCLAVAAPMISTMTVYKENAFAACKKGFINATDLADYLAKKGVPFRSAYKTVGDIVNYCVKNGKTLDEMKIEEYKTFSSVFENDLYAAIDLINCVEKRVSKGSTGFSSVKKQIEKVKEFLNN